MKSFSYEEKNIEMKNEVKFVFIKLNIYEL